MFIIGNLPYQRLIRILRKSYAVEEGGGAILWICDLLSIYISIDTWVTHLDKPLSILSTSSGAVWL